MTKKEKRFLFKLLDNSYALVALSSEADSNDEEAFSKRFEMSIDEGEKLLDEIVKKLK